MPMTSPFVRRNRTLLLAFALWLSIGGGTAAARAGQGTHQGDTNGVSLFVTLPVDSAELYWSATGSHLLADLNLLPVLLVEPVGPRLDVWVEPSADVRFDSRRKATADRIDQYRLTTTLPYRVWQWAAPQSNAQVFVGPRVVLARDVATSTSSALGIAVGIVRVWHTGWLLGLGGSVEQKRTRFTDARQPTTTQVEVQFGVMLGYRAL